MLSPQHLIYQTAQIRALEELAFAQIPITAEQMMLQAGEAAFATLDSHFSKVKHIGVFCGAGNNGGDGYVFARLAHEKEFKVQIWQVGKPQPEKPAAYAAYQACQKAGIPMGPFESMTEIDKPDMVVDALCGIGLNQTLREPTLTAIKKINDLGVSVLAIDVPSGIDADTGNILGAAVKATVTITFIGLKLGLLTGKGLAHTGTLLINELKIPQQLYDQVKPCALHIQLSDYSDYLKVRARDWHKGLSGHVLVVGGDLGYSGAPRMAAEAALRVGAGLVTLATRPENAPTVNATRPEIMVRGVEVVEDLLPLLEKANVIVLGPGLGQSAWSKTMWKACIYSDKPMVVDADALNLLALTTSQSPYWILTPHPGEAGRLLGTDTAHIQQDRLSAAEAIIRKYCGTCVLKGAGSLIVADNYLPALCDKGNAGMATAGMGDVLSGVIGGLLAQGIPNVQAAQLGVLLHALAGDAAAKEGERGLLAMDLMTHLHHLVNV